MVAIFAENDPILKGRLPSTPKGFWATEGRLQPLSRFPSFHRQNPKICLGSDPTMRGRRPEQGSHKVSCKGEFRPDHEGTIKQAGFGLWVTGHKQNFRQSNSN